MEVVLYTRAQCHLCEEAKQVLVSLQSEFAFTLQEVDIDADAGLRRQYDRDVPVVFVNSRKVAKHRLDIRQFRRRLQEAQSEEASQPGR